MKKKLVVLLMATALALNVCACGGNEAPSTDKKENVQAEKKEEVTYQSIFDEYSQKLSDIAPKLAEEYSNEAADKAGDVNALAELSNSKLEELAKISTEGMEKMAELMMKNGDDQSTYEEWATKLTDVYTSEAEKVTEAYLNSASNIDADALLDSINEMMPEQ